MTDEHCVISSLIIETMPENMERVANELAKRDGVEVHGQENGKIVITIEKESLDASYDLASSFVEIPGVLGINLIHVNFEDDPKIQAQFAALQARTKKED